MQPSCPTELVFPPDFLKIVVEVKSSGPPHVLKLVAGKNKGMLPVNTFAPTKLLFVAVKFHGDYKTVINLRQIWSPSILGISPDLKQWCLSISFY